MEHRKPQSVSRKLDETRQKAFIEAYESLLNARPGDEAVMSVDAVHPTHAPRPRGCWGSKDTKVAVDQTSGHQRMNLHGAIDLEGGQTRMREVLTVDAMSTIELVISIEALYPAMRQIHAFLDNARYHHARLVQEWMARPGQRIRLHFIPSYFPHLNPIERLWWLMHANVTDNRCYATFDDFCNAVLRFLNENLPRNWSTLCDEVSDKRLIPLAPAMEYLVFRVLTDV